jgi:hypothetical protein
VQKSYKDNVNLYDCKISNTENNKTKNATLFFKIAPLLDPYKYLIGKYNINDANLFTLPKLYSSDADTHPKFNNVNNAAYVDALFVYFMNELSEKHTFPHGLKYYGSFLGIKNRFKMNVFDDLEYLNNSEFFNKHKNVLFQIDDYEHLFEKEKAH